MTDFRFKGDSIQEELEHLIPQLLDYQYAIQASDVAKLLHCVVMNEKGREKARIAAIVPRCDNYQNFAFCILEKGHKGSHEYDPRDVSPT